MSKIVLFLFALLVFCAPAAWAQFPIEPVNVQSPNAMSLGQYGEVPVSLYTGLPNISIPLYTLKEGSLSVPISLSYHASGYRPDVHPGWVGVGWSLNAGGVISRNVHGTNDELNGNDPNYNVNGYGFFYNYREPALTGPNWDQKASLEDFASNPFRFSLDTEPDEFSFSFNDYSGKFYLGIDGKWKVQCNKPVKVQVMPNPSPVPVPRLQNTGNIFMQGYPKTIGGFILTAEDGTRYQFGGTTDAIEYGLPLFNEYNQMWIANSWYLTKITSPQATEIKFTYVPGDYIDQVYESVYFKTAQETTSTTNWWNPASYASPSCSGNVPSSSDIPYSGKLIRPVYLVAINGKTSTINFAHAPTSELAYSNTLYYRSFQNYASGVNKPLMPFLQYNPPSPPLTLINYPQCLSRLVWQKLTRISVTQDQSIGYQFAFDYTDNPQQRLTLTGLTESYNASYNNIGSSVTKPPYKFTYNTTGLRIPYVEMTTDHWGFYNATYAPINYSQPTTTQTAQTYFNQRQPNTNPSVFLDGMLTSIKYPTGGTTVFEYEQHTYSKSLGKDRSKPPRPSPDDQTAGGLRIRKISSYTKNLAQPASVKEYFYVSGYSNTTPVSSLRSSGVLGGLIQYYYDDYVLTTGNVTYSESAFSSQSVLPACQNSMGSHIGYSEVVEKNLDNSYTIYKYTNFDNGHLDEVVPTARIQDSRANYDPYSSREQERGCLLQETAYNAANTPVKDRVIEYTAFNVATEYARAVTGHLFYVCSNSAVNILTGNAYKFYTYPYLPTKETVTVYDVNGQNPLTTVKTTQYDDPGQGYNYRLVSSESVTDSKGQTLATAYTYPQDIPYPAGQAAPTDSVASAIREMATNNMVGLPIEVKQSRNGLIAGATVQTYRRAGLNASSILPYQTFSLTTNHLLNSWEYASPAYATTANGPFVVDNNYPQMLLKATCTRYDDNGNLLEVFKEGGVVTSYLWSYHNTLPIAKSANAQANEVLVDGFEENGSEWGSDMLYDSKLSHSGVSTFPDDVHTGQNAGRIKGGGQVYCFGKSLKITSAAGRYVFSGWVYTTGPTAQIWLFQNTAADIDPSTGQVNYYAVLDANHGNNYYTYTDTNTTGKWVYLEKEVDIPGDVTTLTLRPTSFDHGGGGTVWFDDLRLYPIRAQVSTYTHTPTIGVTSMSDANNRPVKYEYDDLKRLRLIRDQDGNIVKQYDYHYKNQ